MTDDYYFDPRIAESYDAEHEERSMLAEDIPFYVELAREAHESTGLPVLELGAGTGRVTMPIAEAGVPVVGLERSPAMLEVARRKSEGVNGVEWVQADMTSFALPQRFGLVVIPFRSFLLLTTVAEQKACLARVRDHLVEGGRLALAIFNPDLVVMGLRLSSERGVYRRRDVVTPPNVLYTETSVYDTAEQAFDWQSRIDELTDEGAIISRVEKNLRMRYVFRHEMEHLLALSGFEVEALWGWFDRRPFTADSSEMVWLARRSG